ncbi:hypothetical protein Syun_007212 [Stephania yunnanensis]|uniref:Uncharacterized protein n=1 Tax=Stephania yunnanensis TaxID=152371 RepID=A0AAP0Q267_9MAGN
MNQENNIGASSFMFVMVVGWVGLSISNALYSFLCLSYFKDSNIIRKTKKMENSWILKL